MKQLKEGVIREFGIFAGEMNGYVILEGSAGDLYAFTTEWIPFSMPGEHAIWKSDLP